MIAPQPRPGKYQTAWETCKIAGMARAKALGRTAAPARPAGGDGARVGRQAGRSVAEDQGPLEPFLVVGLIACVRRILVISLETFNVIQPDKWTAQSAKLFQAAMTELGVLAGLVVVMVGAIFFVRRMRLG